MSAKVLSKAAAKEANIEIIENGRGSQALHDVIVAMRAARRSGTANTKTKAEVDLSGAKPVRVAEPVESLVVVADDRQQAESRAERPHDALFTIDRSFSKFSTFNL